MGCSIEVWAGAGEPPWLDLRSATWSLPETPAPSLIPDLPGQGPTATCGRSARLRAPTPAARGGLEGRLPPRGDFPSGAKGRAPRECRAGSARRALRRARTAPRLWTGGRLAQVSDRGIHGNNATEEGSSRGHHSRSKAWLPNFNVRAFSCTV